MVLGTVGTVYAVLLHICAQLHEIRQAYHAHSRRGKTQRAAARHRTGAHRHAHHAEHHSRQYHGKLYMPHEPSLIQQIEHLGAKHGHGAQKCRPALFSGKKQPGQQHPAEGQTVRPACQKARQRIYSAFGRLHKAGLRRIFAQRI